MRGERGIRTLGTGKTPYAGLANRCLQPLGHLSVAGLPNVGWDAAIILLRPARTTCVTLFDYQACGGGGIRTPGACARRFSRPLPSTTRPLLQDDPRGRRGV